jgi:tRNA modification GTPase
LNASDTIAAISSPATGPCARIIVRMSGSKALELARGICQEELPEPPVIGRTQLRIAELPCPAFVYAFRSPRSYSGEDLVEFHIPGNPLLARMLLEELFRRGARQADPGEFTARAYFNGRIDLGEAEGVAATIAAGNEQELSAARQLMTGELSKRLRPIMNELAQTLALIEVGIDFSDEDVTFLSPDQIEQRLRGIDSSLAKLMEESGRFERLGHEPRIVLVGRPNAGKSTLLNVLARHARAVVSPIAGTTRDALAAQVRLKRGLVHVIDVAGIDESTAADDHDIARQMQARALAEIQAADLVVLLRDVTDAGPPLALSRAADVLVFTKADLGSAPSGAMAVSSLTGHGLNELRDRLDELAFGGAAPSTLALNARHLAAIASARDSLKRAMSQLHAGSEILAFDVRESLDLLGGILGNISPDELLGRIFSSFCIGK